MYDMGLWIGPPGAMLAAANLGYSAYAIYWHEKTHGDDAREDEWRPRTEISNTKEGGKERAGEEEGKGKSIALAAAACVAIVPFTWAFLVGTSEVLLRESEGGFGAGMKESVLRDTVVKWGWICAARALLPLVGTAVGVWSVLGW
ncbi:hypothetical protein ABVK25_010827 [Lepraria finkii]|uniref:Uncharacterized protein n=1 Tax=Lepraria finkii TaxID=1340010 RepID=A0ABR4AT43_9LECA